MIETISLTKRYLGLDQPALDNVSVRIHPGAITAVLGPNGSGKTTLLRILAGQEFATGGEVTIGGTPVATDDRVPFFAVAHEGNNLGESRMRDYVAFARSRASWDEATYARLRERFELPKERRPLHKLSLGQQSAFAVTLALASGAPIIVIDEAHAGMDVPKRMALYEELIRANAEQQRTIVIASHNVGELERVAEYVVVLDSGRVLEHTTVDSLSARFVKLVGAKEAVARAAADRPVVAQRALGPTEEWTVDVSQRPLGETAGVVATSAEFQDAFVALLEREATLRKEAVS